MEQANLTSGPPLPPGQRSEVALLIEQIEAEYSSARSAIYELRVGEARHDFITKRMQRTQEIAQQLIATIGADAVPLIVDAMQRVEYQQLQGGH